jgi:hypothetical protein
MSPHQRLCTRNVDREKPAIAHGVGSDVHLWVDDSEFNCVL